MDASYSIRAVAEETGLSVHTIRAWEKRHQVLEPTRSPSGRRIYRKSDVDRLKLLFRAVHAGHSIGLIANLPNSELEKLDVRAEPSPISEQAPQIVKEVELAVRSYDGVQLDQILSRAQLILGVDSFLRDVIIPILSLMDSNWENQTMGIAHEHLATALIRNHLDRIRMSLPIRPHAPRIVVATPAGQIHEIGAELVAIMAAREGWDVVYLGANLPASEIALAAKEVQAQAVGLSIVYPANDPQIASELAQLRQELGPDTLILVGGRATTAYGAALAGANATPVTSLSDLGNWLRQVRRR